MENFINKHPKIGLCFVATLFVLASYIEAIL